jgi:hypothetical protein
MAEAPSSLWKTFEANQGKAKVKKRFLAATFLAAGRTSQDRCGLLQTPGSVENSPKHDAIARIGWRTGNRSAIPRLGEPDHTLAFVELSEVEIHERPVRRRKKTSGAAQCRNGLRVAGHLGKRRSVVEPGDGALWMMCEMALRKQSGRSGHTSSIEPHYLPPLGFVFVFVS